MEYLIYLKSKSQQSDSVKVISYEQLRSEIANLETIKAQVPDPEHEQVEIDAKLSALSSLMDNLAVSAQGYVSQDQIQEVIGILQQDIATYAEFSVETNASQNNIIDFKAALSALQYILNLHESNKPNKVSSSPQVMTYAALNTELDFVASEKQRLSREMNKYQQGTVEYTSLEDDIRE